MASSNRSPGGACSSYDAAVEVVGQLRQAGCVAYLAGGCVRDRLLGYDPKDYDVATDARPEKVRGLFRRSRFVGESFGVVQVYWGQDPAGQSHMIEVATFRSEWGYQDGRRPSQVHFTDAQSDAQRRDFTINALFEDPLAQDENQRIIDYVGGVADLTAGVIRAVGDAQSRLSEDYLRLLRAVRFAARLRFAIEPKTADAIALHAKDLGRISRERIGQEIMWMLTPGVPPGASATVGVDGRSGQAIKLIQGLGLDGATLDEDCADVPLCIVNALLDEGGVSPDAGPRPAVALTYTTMLAAWLLDRYFFSRWSGGQAAATGKPNPDKLLAEARHWVDHGLEVIVGRWRRSLRLSNGQRDDLAQAVGLLPTALAWPELTVAGRKRLLAKPLWPQVNALLWAVSVVWGLGSVAAAAQNESRDLVRQGVSPAPWVSGADLIAMGRKPGPAFSRLLDAVYDAQLDGTVTSRTQALAWLREHD